MFAIRGNRRIGTWILQTCAIVLGETEALSLPLTRFCHFSFCSHNTSSDSCW